MHRIRLIASLVLVVLAAAACSSDSSATRASAPASSSAAPSPTTTPPGKSLHATSTTTEQPTIGQPICDAQQHCMYPLTTKDTVSGDLMGTSISNGAGALFGDKFAAGDTLIFTGTVVGCGSGTMVLLGTGTGSTTGKTVSNWIVAEGVGEGDLLRVHGGGTTSIDPQPDGSGTATIEAHLTC